MWSRLRRLGRRFNRNSTAAAGAGLRRPRPGRRGTFKSARRGLLVVCRVLLSLLGTAGLALVACGPPLPTTTPTPFAAPADPTPPAPTPMPGLQFGDPVQGRRL